MAIGTVNVVVPSSGDGPIANIANLVSEKTVELSGRFDGRYILLGSHNGVNFVPVLIFDANGEESIKLTLSLALVAVRVRAAASSPSGVTMNVSGVLGVSNNLFATVATLPPGASGPQPPINLATLFPPTGLDQDINFLCVGGFQGLITIKGSMDGIHFNPIESFRTDNHPPSLLGSPAILEFSPLTTQDLIRYLQIDITGTVTNTTIITMGGCQSSVASGPTLDVGIVTLSNILYALQAKSSATVPFTDSVGNTLSTPGPGLPPPDITCIGQRNQKKVYAGLPAVVIGSDNTAWIVDSVVIGQRLAIDCLGFSDVIIGQDIILSTPSFFTRNDILAIGHAIEIGGAGNYSPYQNILIGSSLYLNQPPDLTAYAYSNVIIGDTNHLGGDSWDNLIMVAGGSLASLDLFISGDNCVFGDSGMGSHMSHCHSFGVFNTTYGDSDHCTVVGGLNRVEQFSSQTHLFGDNHFAGNSINSRPISQVLLAGTHLSCFSSDLMDPLNPLNQPLRITVLGHFCSVRGPVTDDTVVIGTDIHITNAANSVFIGAGRIQFDSIGTSSCVVIGDHFSSFDASFGYSVAIGGSIHVVDGGEGVVIGYGASIGAGTYALVIGTDATATSVNTDNGCIAIGEHASAADSQCVIGNSDTTHVPNPSIRHFVVRGVVGTIGGGATAIDTISAISEPIPDYTGLTVTYNDGAAISNKTIQAMLEGSLLPGTKVLYII
jgi:hypothetical protein